MEVVHTTKRRENLVVGKNSNLGETKRKGSRKFTFFRKQSMKGKMVTVTYLGIKKKGIILKVKMEGSRRPTKSKRKRGPE